MLKCYIQCTGIFKYVQCPLSKSSSTTLNLLHKTLPVQELFHSGPKNPASPGLDHVYPHRTLQTWCAAAPQICTSIVSVCQKQVLGRRMCKAIKPKVWPTINTACPSKGMGGTFTFQNIWWEWSARQGSALLCVAYFSALKIEALCSSKLTTWSWVLSRG